MWAGMLFEESFDFQATMFQPVGGMDRIPMAFARKLGPVVRLASEVTAIRRTGSGVSVSYLDKRSGKSATVDGAYCIVTIPLKVLDGIDADFSPTYRAAIHNVEYGNAVKIAWQSRRFWETEDHIYGGISWVKGPTDHGLVSERSAFLAKGDPARRLFNRADADLLAAQPLACTVRDESRRDRSIASRSRQGARKANGDRLVEGALQPRHRGALPSDQDGNYAVLSEPDGPFYFAGEHLSHVGAWQEGAILSARRAINMIDKHRRAQHA